MFENLLLDLRRSVRMLAKAPAFTVVAIGALALGIGANTAIFSVVNAVLLQPAAFPDPDRLVQVLIGGAQGEVATGSPTLFAHMRQESSIAQEVAAYTGGFMNYTGGGFPEELRSQRVSADFFRLFGVPVALGRAFAPAEDRPGGPLVVVISHELWETRFGRDPDVLGRTIPLSGDAYQIIGVLGEFDFRDFGTPPQVLVPFQLDPSSSDQGAYFRIAGRLRPGITLEQARARMRISTEEFSERFPDFLGADGYLTVEPISDFLVGSARPALLVLAGAVGFVLLIACANVANLLLARAAGRRRELAVRAAIGASRRQIIRQLLTESVVLSLAGGVLGLIIGWVGIRVLLRVNTAGLPRVGEGGSLVSMDGRVLAFTLLISICTGVLFGLIPALQGSKTDLTAYLKEGGARSGAGPRQSRARSVLVGAQVATALVLLIGSGLLIRTAVALARVDSGLDSSGVLTMRMSLAGSDYISSEAVGRLVREGSARLRALPGVVEASATCCLPLVNNYGGPFEVVGRPLEAGPFHGGAGWRTVSPGYFDVFGIPVLRGRAFDDRDGTEGVPVAIINETMARQFWPEGDPLDDRIVIARNVMPQFADEPERQIVGIVGDTRDRGLTSELAPMMFIPQAQVTDSANALVAGLTPIAWVVRTEGSPAQMSAIIQDEIRQATGLPVSNVRSMDEVRSRSIARERFNMWVMAIFGCSALLLAAMGIYGLLAYSVEQRAREIGIRLALGADTAQVRGMLVRQGLAPALVGIVIGAGGALALTRIISGLLFGVESLDPLVFAGVPALLLSVALLAAWLPSGRATRIDAMIALRRE